MPSLNAFGIVRGAQNAQEVECLVEWLNAFGIVRGAQNAQEVRYNCESMPFFGGNHLINYQTTENEILRLVSASAFFRAISDSCEVIFRTGGNIARYLISEFVKFLCRVNDYNMRHFASGFRLSLAQLIEVNSDMPHVCGELPRIQVDARAIWFFARTKKDLEMRRDKSYMEQYATESNMVKDLRRVFVLDQGARLIRNMFDIGRTVWSDGEIHAILADRTGPLCRYIQDVRNSNRRADYPNNPINEHGLIGLMYGAGLDVFQAHSGSGYINVSSVTSLVHPVNSINDYVDKGAQNPIIYSNIIGDVYPHGNRITKVRLLNYIRNGGGIFDIVTRGLDSENGVAVDIPIIFSVKKNTYEMNDPVSFVINRGIAFNSENMRDVISLKRMNLNYLIFDSAMVRAREQLIEYAYPKVVCSVRQAPNVSNIPGLLGSPMRAQIVYFVDDESFKSLFVDI